MCAAMYKYMCQARNVRCYVKKISYAIYIYYVNYIYPLIR